LQRNRQPLTFGPYPGALLSFRLEVTQVSNEALAVILAAATLVLALVSRHKALHGLSRVAVVVAACAAALSLAGDLLLGRAPWSVQRPAVQH
jgi:hypothetical protein